MPENPSIVTISQPTLTISVCPLITIGTSPNPFCNLLQRGSFSLITDKTERISFLVSPILKYSITGPPLSIPEVARTIHGEVSMTILSLNSRPFTCLNHSLVNGFSPSSWSKERLSEFVKYSGVRG